jgi:glycosyltransferase involved in cell wall biosynthesis
VLEAYAAGLPVIVSRVGALPDLVNDEQTGLVVEPGSPAALARAMRRLCAPAARNAMARRAAAHLASYAPEHFLRRKTAVYRSAVAAARRRGGYRALGSRRATTVTSWRLW